MVGREVAFPPRRSLHPSKPEPTNMSRLIIVSLFTVCFIQLFCLPLCAVISSFNSLDELGM